MTENRDLTKLPKWAQEHVARLESSLVYWKGRAGGEGIESNTWVAHGPHRRALDEQPKTQYLPNDCVVSFGTIDGDVIEVAASIHGGVEVRTSHTSGARLVVLPVVSNVVTVDVVPWPKGQGAAS